VNFYQDAIEEVGYTHSYISDITTMMLDSALKFYESIITLIVKMMTEHAAHDGAMRGEAQRLVALDLRHCPVSIPIIA
jgi:hypothetical protein